MIMRKWVRILTIHDAEHFCYAQEGADEKGKVSLLPDLHFAEAGKVRIADAGQAVESIWNVYGQTEPNVYELTLEYEYHPADALSGDVWLELDFGGDCARLYQDGKLLDDWFSNGELWRVALKRYGYPTKLTLELDPFKPDVYYDLPAVAGEPSGRGETAAVKLTGTRFGRTHFGNRRIEKRIQI